jgi:hypothetical protein
MKNSVVLLAIPLICFVTSSAIADTCIKQKHHTDEYYYGGIVTPEEDSDFEMWFGDKKMAYISHNRIVIVDTGKGVLLFANMIDSTYVETTLPFDWANVVDENTIGTLARYQTEGTVKDTGKTKTILGRKSKCVELSTWIESDGEKFNQRDEVVWVTTDLPIDWEAYEKIQRNSLKLMNYNDALVDAFSSLTGVPIEADAEVYQKGFSVKSTERSVEIIEAKPETNVYSLPSYFKKKDQLSMADLRG